MPRKPRRSTFGNVRQLGSGRWQARFREDGSYRTPEPGVTYDTKREAEEALRDYEADKRRGRLGNKPQDTILDDFAWRWLAEHTAENPPNTQVDYESIVRLGILRHGGPLTGKPIADITPMMVRAWLRYLSKPWVDAEGKERPAYGPARRGKAGRILSRLMKDAKGERLIDSNPCDGITFVTKAQKVEAKRQHYYLYCAEIARIIAAADYVPTRGHENWGLFFEILAWSGMRPQEVRALWPEQVNREGRFILVNAAISDGSKKTDMRRGTTKPGYERSAYLPAAVMDRLVEWIEDRNLDRQQLVFPGEDGVSFMWPSTYREQGWLPMLGVAGVGPDATSFLRGRRQTPITYDLRAALVSHLLGAGVPQVDVGAQVGHVDAETTALYTVVQQAGLEDPIAVAARRATDQTRAKVIEYLYEEAQRTLG